MREIYADEKHDTKTYNITISQHYNNILQYYNIQHYNNITTFHNTTKLQLQGGLKKIFFFKICKSFLTFILLG